MTNAIVPQSQTALSTQSNPLQSAIGIVLFNLSETSKRQYALTFKKWTAYCADNALHPSQMTAQNIIGFLNSDTIAHSTKQARLSHLRKVLEAMHAQNPSDVQIESLYKQIRLLKIKRTETEKQGEARPRHALTSKQKYKALDYYADDTLIHRRNRAMLALLLFVGMRRAELVALKWSDIDTENELITIRHGKGDKERTVGILGGIEYIEDFKRSSEGRTFVFTGIRKDGVFLADKPLRTNAVWRVLKPIETTLDIEGLSPHDLRRTLATEALNSGASVADVQYQLGHANAETTLRYAVIKSASDVKARLKSHVS